MRSDLAAVAAAFVLQLLVTGTSCFVNVAHTPGQGLYGTATMNELPHTNGWSADKVVDGITTQTANGGSCAIMDFSKNYTSVWLKVQLGRRFNVAYIEIYFRNEKTLDRMSGYSIYAFYDDTFDDFASLDPNNLVYHHDPMSGCLPPVQNITINKPARQVVFTIHRTTEFQSSCTDNRNIHTGVEICEIKVMGCDQNKYSSGCESVCSQDCKDQHCDAFNGSCKDCKDGNYILNGVCQECPGHCQNDEFCNKETGKCDNGCKNQWTGHFCNQCSDYFYGSDCNTACGHCSNNDVCDKKNGRCPNGCQSYWAGEKCDVCEDGFYNATCSAACGRCIRSEPCEKNTGMCINGCRSNFQPPLCQDCVSNKYGPNCAFDCGHCKNGRSCAVKNGVCIEGCDSGWIGDLCVTENQLTTTGVAIIASISTMFAISLFVIFFMGRHIMKNKTNRHQTDVPVPKNKTPPQTYVDLSVMDDNHAYSSLGSTVPETPYNVI